jgi:hypothetical protein
MTQFPMNNNTPNGQTHTIMESPIWMGRLHSYWPTFAATWFSIAWLGPLLLDKYFPAMITYSFIFAIPLILASYIDEHFTSTFFKRDWEESKKMDALSIRGILVPVIREYIEFQISLRKKFIVYSVSIYAASLILMWNPTPDLVLSANCILLIGTFFGGIIRTKIGNDKFGFNSSYFKKTTEFKSFR